MEISALFCVEAPVVPCEMVFPLTRSELLEMAQQSSDRRRGGSSRFPKQGSATVAAGTRPGDAIPEPPTAVAAATEQPVVVLILAVVGGLGRHDLRKADVGGLGGEVLRPAEAGRRKRVRRRHRR